MIKNKFGLLLLLLIGLSMAACDYLYDYTYQVTNDSDADITIELKSFQIDSIYIIPVNETRVLFITDHGVEGAKGPYFEDVTMDLDEFIVVKDGTLTSSRNYLDNSSWDYADGLYSTTINNEEFK
ncbi:hypothetical protein [Carboxylicivirga sp. M1479]|uniref:hypothetical protein n=1 Tax=Carboxylicivirga sp. M1479 TaxID=2594476 RepID=UPI001177FBCE|nr:hypothetical protein [Carboxylicivirga sp. M1479]TRX61666.1 hypothetical protein FNN09_20130 [Carboxylicivirga sp. M1479]